MCSPVPSISSISESQPSTSYEKWPRNITIQLIDLLKEKDVLWNSKHKDYKNKLKRDNALKNIAEELGSYYTLEKIKSKIHNLRCQFRREHRNVSMSSKSGSGSADVHSPKLWCYDGLQFLKDSDVPRASFSNLKQNKEFEADDDEGVSGPSPNPHTSSIGVPRIKRAKTSSIDEAIKLTLESLNSGSSEKSFGSLVQHKLSALDIEQKEIAEHIILNVLRLGRLGQLTFDHQIVRVTPYNPM